MMWFLGILWACICFLCGIGWDIIVWLFQEFPTEGACFGVFLILALIGSIQFIVGIFSVFGALFEGIANIFK